MSESFIETKKAVVKGSRLLRTKLRKKLRAKKKIASRKTYNSIKVKKSIGFNKFTSTLVGSEVLNFINDGRKPNSKMPPKGSLLEWIKDKKIKGRDKKGRFIKNETLEYLIRRSIGIKGIKPTRILDEVFDECKPQIDKLIRDSSQSDLSIDIVSQIRAS